jgi:hypothetical protein
MTKNQLTEAYHKLANEAMAVQRRVELRDQHREVFDRLWKAEISRQKKLGCCEECERQEYEYGAHEHSLV